MRKLEQDIKNKIFKKVYLLYGDQAYLRNQYRDKLVNELVASGDTMNYTYYQGDEFTLGELIDLAETMPFLAERRVIVVENSGLFNESNDDLAEYIPTIPDTTCIIFTEEKVNSKYKSVKAVKSTGTAVEFTALDEASLKQWVINRLSREHRKITGSALDKFLSICGNDMMFISLELEKLISYTFNKEGIYIEDIDAICTVQIEEKVFQMLDALFRKDADEALRLYGDLLALHEAPLRVLTLIENQLRLLLHVRQMDQEGLSTKSMADALSMNEYRIKKALPQARKSSKIWIMSCLDYCADIDAASKSGKIMPQIGLETVILKLSAL